MRCQKLNFWQETKTFIPMPIDISAVQSPCYVLDADLLRKNLQLIDDVRRRSGADIILAFKAFAMWSAFPIVREYFSTSTASSVNEALLAYRELGSRAHTYSPAYTERDFPTIVECSSHITFNSLTQYNRFVSAAKAAEHYVSIGLRVNPECSGVETDLYNPCKPGSRLGITADQLPDKLPQHVEGLHFHALCEGSPDDLAATLQAFEERFAHWLPQVKWVNFGGGHLMTRSGYDCDQLVDIIRSFRERYGVQVILEPGSAFAWDTGVLVAQVVDIVENHGIRTAILDVSFAAHMPDCLEMPYKPRIRGAYYEPVSGKPTYRMGGNSCLSGDYVGDWSFTQELKVGDKIVFEDMIHYTIVKTTMFNGVPHPDLAIYSQAEGLRIVKRFDYEDYKQRMG